MTKVMFLLHRADIGAILQSADLRASLTAVGAIGLAVNIDDADVAPALRFGTSEPISAVVSVWTAGELADVVAVVAAVVGEPGLHGYRVTERVRLDPLPVADGVRLDALAQLAVLRRPGTMTRDEYLEYWQVHHTPIAIRTQNTSGYIQNIVVEPLTGDSPEVAAIVEEHFPMAALTDPHAFYGSGGDEAELNRRMSELMASVARFGADRDLDLVPTSRYRWDLART